MTSKNFAIRTVKKGSVRVDGVTYRPNEQYLPYDGRLDGQRFAFGRYITFETYLPFISLWGTEEFFRNGGESPTLPQVVDGVFPWDWWHAVE